MILRGTGRVKQSAYRRENRGPVQRKPRLHRAFPAVRETFQFAHTRAQYRMNAIQSDSLTK